MKVKLGTRIEAATARYTLPFFIPNDTYFSEIYVKTAYDAYSYSLAVYLRVYVYENDEDFKDLTNPVMLFRGWVRNGEEQDYQRIPINYIVDKDNYSRFFITADYTGGTAGYLHVEILYSDRITSPPNYYHPQEHRGRLDYSATITGNAGLGVEQITFEIQDGETFEVRDIRLINVGGTDITTYYQLYPLGKARTHQTNDGDHIYLDPVDRGQILHHGDIIIIYTLGVDVAESFGIRITGYPSSAVLPTTALIGAGALINEVWGIF